MGDEQIVLVVGAGGTVADAMNRPFRRRPPLDRGFFKNTIRTHGGQLKPVTDYLRNHYDVDATYEREDSLERVMAKLYTDVYGGILVDEAFEAFRVLIKVFLARLAATTNRIHMTKQCRLYRLIVGFLNRGTIPENLTIITFNQDIQIEKALDTIAGTAGRAGQLIFAFPGCYHINAKRGVTRVPDRRVPQFRPSRGRAKGGIAVLKLHGSLNWYSAHRWRNPSRIALFDPKRRIGITTRKNIGTAMRLGPRAGGGTPFTFPIVVPPVAQKSGIFHDELRPVWNLAEGRLKSADRIVIFGYSCPQNDWESANLISRALTKNTRCREVSVIDPDSSVLLRYVELGGLDAVSYFKSCDAYLASE